jgi:hypothetical protein
VTNAGARGFPSTRLSVIRASQSADPDVRREGFESLIAAYWKPVYKYLRLKWHVSDEDARDLTQAFFARTLDKGFFDRYDATRARFRTWIRTCLDGFVANERKAGSRLKRGGGMTLVPLEFETAEGEIRQHDAVADSATLDQDAYFQQEFVRSVLALAIERVRARAETAGRAMAFTIFERYDVQGADETPRPTYAALAAELDVAVHDITNALAWARKELRAAVLDVLRSVSATDEEFRSEAQAILGFDPKHVGKST